MFEDSSSVDSQMHFLSLCKRKGNRYCSVGNRGHRVAIKTLDLGEGMATECLNNYNAQLSVMYFAKSPRKPVQTSAPF